jgi:hypothetical protein
MTNLSSKFTQLEGIITAKFDAVLLALGSIHTALTSSGGNIDAAPIVAAIEAMRGTGPENTIHSLNQSVWNIAGPTPGKSLAEIHTLLVANHAANAVYLAAIGADTDATANALGIPTGDATTTALGLLASVVYALTYPTANAANLYGTIKALNDAVGGVPNNSLTLTSVRGLLDMLTQQQRSLLNPMAFAPYDVCETSYSSTGTVYFQNGVEIFPGFSLVYPATCATWPVPPLVGYESITRTQDLTGYYSKLTNTDWASYRIYVASNAPLFGLSGTSPQRYATNQWLVLTIGGISGNDMFFIVDGVENLKVYICPSTETIGGTAPGAPTGTISAATSVADGRRYVTWPAIEGVTASVAGIELTPDTSWDGYEVYISRRRRAPPCTISPTRRCPSARSIATSGRCWVPVTPLPSA